MCVSGTPHFTIIEQTQLCVLRARKTLMTNSRCDRFMLLFLKVKGDRGVFSREYFTFAIVGETNDSEYIRSDQANVRYSLRYEKIGYFFFI